MIGRVKINELSEVIEFIKNKDISMSKAIEKQVRRIVEDIRFEGDRALNRYTKEFDKVELGNNFRVSKEELEEAYKRVNQKLLKALELAANNIFDFHRKQITSNINMITENKSQLGLVYKPLQRIGVYVPGGLGAYPSTVLMNVIPAKIAGVREIVIFTPPGRNGKIPESVGACATLLGIDEVYKIGGAQAIVAGAFGTQTIKRVDKIVGPGNAYVACAKREIYGYVAIDSVAGPSEILIIGDKTANPKYVAADLLSQAEHDKMAKAYLVTDSMELAIAVENEIKNFTNKLSRKEVIVEALKNSYIFLVDDINLAFDIANLIAPEHLELMGASVEDRLDEINNAGAIFVGEYSPEPIGDYIAGTNHVLPTDGNARFSSGLCVMDFMKHTSVVKYSREDFKLYAPYAVEIASNEGLTAHRNSLTQRLCD